MPPPAAGRSAIFARSTSRLSSVSAQTYVPPEVTRRTPASRIAARVSRRRRLGRVRADRCLGVASPGARAARPSHGTDGRSAAGVPGAPVRKVRGVRVGVLRRGVGRLWRARVGRVGGVAPHLSGSEVRRLRVASPASVGRLLQPISHGRQSARPRALHQTVQNSAREKCLVKGGEGAVTVIQFTSGTPAVHRGIRATFTYDRGGPCAVRRAAAPGADRGRGLPRNGEGASVPDGSEDALSPAGSACRAAVGGAVSVSARTGSRTRPAARSPVPRCRSGACGATSGGCRAGRRPRTG